MTLFPMPHPMRWFPGKFIQPQMDFLIWLSEKSGRFFAMVFEGGHIGFYGF